MTELQDPAAAGSGRLRAGRPKFGKNEPADADVTSDHGTRPGMGKAGCWLPTIRLLTGAS